MPQFETSDDPLEKITTAEAIRTLIDFYRASHFCYSAREKVEDISKVVSCSPFSDRLIDFSHYFNLVGIHLFNVINIVVTMEVFGMHAERNSARCRRQSG
jgi:hypothetical protein